ncbi:hypothetical protein THF1A12_40271 [Vibrio jasicida]|uniref:Uncharacterized protein n=1 Tax=Vibrio jasicida TaxID=766224 RepID=A0AAU9QRE2_9VIBR|nr:hypothetical protein THF1A12_40271 [Vibrio jasicida]
MIAALCMASKSFIVCPQNIQYANDKRHHDYTIDHEIICAYVDASAIQLLWL